MTDQRRNLNPHKPALIAMWLWGYEYAAQSGGSMDFWDRLSSSRKDYCRELLGRLGAAPGEFDPDAPTPAENTND